MEHATGRLAQEVARLGGHYAHVLDEHIDSKRDDVVDESWLHGRFSYVLCRRTGSARAKQPTARPQSHSSPTSCAWRHLSRQ